MIQVAFIFENGEISHIISPGRDDMYENEAYYDNLLAVHISANEDPVEFSDTLFWSFQASRFLPKPSRPSFAHDWHNSGTWVFNQDKFWTFIRNKRSHELYLSDWTQMPDAPLTEEEKEEWRLYRQSLRDIPASNQGVTVESLINWPEKPTTPRN
jgi:hypothetical protein